MQVVREPDKQVSDLWGSGRIESGNYRRFTYLLEVPAEGGSLLYNTVTGEMLLMNPEELRNFPSLPCDYAPWMDALIQKHFLVKAESDDRYCVDALRRMLRLAVRTKDITGYTILPTTCCNAHCFYCYEAGVRHETMTEETANRLVDFIEAHCGEKKEVSLGWFGGEPMIGANRIDQITGELAARGIAFRSNMVSNGYLFDKELAKHAADNWHLKSVQITLDGTEHVYNETKAYKNPCASPFRKVLENIGYLLENGILVSVRLNVGQHNGEDLISLVDELAAVFHDKTNLTVYSHLLFDGCGFDSVHFTAEQLSELGMCKTTLDRRIHENGFLPKKGRLPRLKTNNCMADGDGSILVLPSGKIGKCEHDTDKNFIGDLKDGFLSKEKAAIYKETVLLPICSKCPLYPACIKLRRCKPDTACGEERMLSELERVKTEIGYYYEDYLHSDNKTDWIISIREGGEKNEEA